MDKVKQSAVFLQIYIRDNQVDALEKLLNSGGNPSRSGDFFDLSKLKTVHFSRWLIAPAVKGKFRASVIYSGNVDGSAEQHLKDLAEHFSNELDQILSHCDGYPESSNLNATSRLAYLKSRSFKTPTFYVGVPERSVTQIKNEDKLHQALRDYVHQNRGKWKTQKEAHKAIKKFVADDPQWDWARKDFQMPKKKIFKLILFAIFMLAILPLVILGILSVFLFHEIWDKKKTLTANDIPIPRMKELKDQEDIIHQNQLSQVFETKSGMRKVMLKFILWVTNFLAANFAVEGQLMGTPTIHFARWVFIDGGKRFVFFSNFDGSYDGYLGDFVDNNGWGLNAIYGAAKGYPKTWFIFGGGSYKISLFMGWGRNTQVNTPIWYSAYPWDGLQQINSKSHLRTLLFNKGELNDEETKELLRRI